MQRNPPDASPKPQFLKVVLHVGNRGVLSSQEGEAFRKEGDAGEGKKEGKKDIQKVLNKRHTHYTRRHVCMLLC